MHSMAQPLVRSTSSRTVKNMQKPRLPRTSSSQSRMTVEPSSPHVPLQDLMTLVESASQCLLDKNYNDLLTSNVATMHARLKIHGPELETIFKDQLDRAFVIFRDGCQDDGLLCATRLNLLELVELRANQWTNCDNSHTYYSAKMAAAELEPIVTTDGSTASSLPISTPSPPMPPVLGPGEVLKTSGKFPKPTKIPGKNYCKDEVVIRNSDSGKEVMRPLIIRSPVMWNSARYLYPPRFFPPSYHPPFWTPRPGYVVNPGAKERLVQITGPSEDKIVHARQLMEETIRRNASPVRESSERERMGGSSSSLNSSASDESNRLNQSGSRRSVLLHSYSTNDASIGEYKYTVTLGNDTVKLTGTNHETVRNARLVLEEYYNAWIQKNCVGDSYGLDDVFVDPHQDMACYRIDSIDSVSGLDSGLGYSAMYQPERRAVLGRSNSIPLSPTSVSHNPVAVSRKYSREFLMMCAESHHSHAAPLNWEQIVHEVPAIIKKVEPCYAYSNYLSPYTYSDAWTYINPYIYP